MALRNVIVVGAGGNLGPFILSTFSGDTRFNVSVLSRQSSKSTFPENIKVYRIGDDYPANEVLEAFKGQDVVISTIATSNTRQQESLIDIAIKAGVKRFIPSEFGSDTTNDKVAQLLPAFFSGKKSTVNYLVGKEKEGLTWSAFVTGPFFELYVFLLSHSS
jgi:NmrA-like family